MLFYPLSLILSYFNPIICICLHIYTFFTGDKQGAENQNFKSVFEVNKIRPLDKRKRKRNDDAADIEGYLGPWAKYEGEETISKPEGEDAEYLEEYLSKMSSRGKDLQLSRITTNR